MLPNLITIGAMKCATTSLHYYLSLHPEISMSRRKELDFFVSEKNWERGIEWYKSNFIGKAKIYGESSPNYTLYPIFSGVPERMHSVVPEAKLIYVVRDPVDRLLSHYVHSCSKGREKREPAEALTDFNSAYFYRSRYYMQLEQYLQYFPGSNILVISNEDLFHHRRETLRKVFKFLDVDEAFDCPQFSKLKHTSGSKREKDRFGLFLEQVVTKSRVITPLPAKVRRQVENWIYLPFSHEIKRPTLNAEARQKLINNLADDVNRLREYTGNNFENWCV